MNSKRDIVYGTPLQEFLRVEGFTAIPKAVFLALLQLVPDCDMSALSQASGSSVQMLGKIAGSSASSNCRPLSWAFQTMCFATANCSTVFLPQVAGCLALKPLRSAARYNGCMQLKELPIGLAPTLSLGTIFFHEYGRRVGMVPRSSLKEGKNRQMVEKGTKAPKP